MLKLSVITATYKDPDGLQATLESLTSAADSIAEWIVIDSSPEVSRPILDHAAASLSCQHIVVPADGIYPAMNRGIQAALGDVLWFLNSGDLLFDRSVLEDCLTQLGDPTIDAIFSGARLSRDDKYLYSVFPPRSFWDGVKNGNRICHQAVLYRHKAFKKLFPYNTSYNLAADFELHLRAHIAGLKTASIPGDLVAFDMSGASSNTAAVLREFGQIATTLGQGLWGQRLRAGVFTDTLRVRALKAVSQSGIGPKLRPLWVAWKRKMKG